MSSSCTYEAWETSNNLKTRWRYDCFRAYGVGLLCTYLFSKGFLRTCTLGSVSYGSTLLILWILLFRMPISSNITYLNMIKILKTFILFIFLVMVCERYDLIDLICLVVSEEGKEIVRMFLIFKYFLVY